MNKTALISALVLSMSAAGNAAESTRITGKNDLVCASRDVVACVPGPNCLQGNAGTFDVPAFLFVGFKSQDIRGVKEEGSEIVSPIRSRETTEQSFIMQGYENHHGWTMAIARQSGEFTLSSTGPEVDFMIMGACTPL